MIKITSQQVSAVHVFMMKQVNVFVNKKNKLEMEILMKKAQPSILKMQKAIDKLKAEIVKFNAQTHKTQGKDVGPTFDIPYDSKVKWTNKPANRGFHSTYYSTSNNNFALSATNKDKLEGFKEEVELFLLKLQLEEASYTDIDKFLKKLLK